jgi:hypothetical protein
LSKQYIPSNSSALTGDIQLNPGTEMHPANKSSIAIKGSLNHDKVSCLKSVESNLSDLQLKSTEHSSSHPYLDKTTNKEVIVEQKLQLGSVETLEDTTSNWSVNGRINFSRRENKMLVDERDMMKELHQQQYNCDSQNYETSSMVLFDNNGRKTSAENRQDSAQENDKTSKKALSKNSPVSFQVGNGTAPKVKYVLAT